MTHHNLLGRELLVKQFFQDNPKANVYEIWYSNNHCYQLWVDGDVGEWIWDKNQTLIFMYWKGDYNYVQLTNIICK